MTQCMTHGFNLFFFKLHLHVILKLILIGVKAIISCPLPIVVGTKATKGWNDVVLQRQQQMDQM